MHSILWAKNIPPYVPSASAFANIAINATPIAACGNSNGDRMIKLNRLFPENLILVAASPARKLKVVVSKATKIAIITLIQSASSHSELEKNSSNQRSDKLSGGKLRYPDSEKEEAITTRIGAGRNTNI